MSRRRLVTVAFLLVLLAVKTHFLIQFGKSAQASQPVEAVDGDIGHYLQIAKNLSDYGVYSDNQSGVPTESATWRPPVWPLILSLFFLVSENQVVLLALKMLLELGIFFWALRGLRKHFDLSHKLYFLLLFVFFEPQLLRYSSNFLTESLSAVLLFALSVWYMTSVGKRASCGFATLCAVVILCHPVSVFFVATLFAIYIWKADRSQMGQAVASVGVFVMLMAAWPVRNAIIFDKGLYLTASQGATFSKGWNDKVAEDFTNTRGDDADENNNLKYLPQKDFPRESTTEMSRTFKDATNAFIDQASIGDLTAIAMKKLASNFNPFCETPKEGLLENLASFARLFYLANFILLIVYLVKLRRTASPLMHAIFAVIGAVLVGQIAMSVYIYTGLRFNSIYGVTLLACLLLVASETVFKKFLR